MKKLSTVVFLVLYIGFLGLTSVYAADTTGDKTIVGQKITTLQATDSGLPGGVTEQKGSVGTILSKVFDATGQIGNVYLKAIGTITSGYVPRWNGTSLINGQIRDDGTNVGIGASAITGIKLGVSGIIRSTTDMQANRYCDTAGGNCFTPTQVDLNGADIGGSGTPNYIPKFVGTGTTLANSSIQDNGSIITIPIPTTFSQTLNAQTGYTIGGKNLVSNNGLQITANYPDNTRYGYFEVRNNSNQRGAYFGYGNGGNTVDLTLDNASNLSISGGNTLIGGATTLSSVNNTSTTPDILFNQAGLIGAEGSLYMNIDSTNTSTSGVFKVGKDSGTATATEIFSVNEAGNGNFLGTVTAATPTAATHLTTKSYVDGLVGGTSFWNLADTNEVTLTGSYDLDIEGFAAIGPAAGDPDNSAALKIGGSSFGGNTNRSVFQTYVSETLDATTLTANRTSYGHYLSLINNKGGSTTNGDRSYADGFYSMVRNTGSSYAYENTGLYSEARNESTAGATNIFGVDAIARQFDGAGSSNVANLYGGQFQAFGRSSTEAGSTTVTSARAGYFNVSTYNTDMTTAYGVYANTSTNNSFDGAITTAYGVRGDVNSASATLGASITNGFGGYFYSYGLSTAPLMTASTGLYARATDGVNAYGGQFYANGTRPTNNYAIYASAVGAISSNYAIYAANGSNYFAGDLRIGSTTLSPGLTVDVTGKVGATEYCDANGTNCVTPASLASNASLWTANGVNISNSNTGNVGIGVTSPTSKLHISGEINQLGTTANTYGITGRPASTGYGGVLGYSQNASIYGILGHANTYSFYGNGAGYFGGNVGIGVAPTKALEVAGMTKINQGSVYDVWIEGEGTTGTAPRNLAILGVKSTDKLYVNYNNEYSGGTQIGSISMDGTQIDNVTCIGNCF